MSPIESWAPLLIVPLTLSLALAPPAAGGLRETYRDSLAAIETGQWIEAERLLREALELHPTEARRLPFKRVLQPYLPHYYLGVVRSQQGDCRGALAEWQLSEDQQAIHESEAEADMRRDRAVCEEHLERIDLLAAEGERALAAATRKADSLADPSRAPFLTLGFEGGHGLLGQRLETARAQIESAREQIGRAVSEQNRDLAEEAVELARESDDLLAEALVDADRIAAEHATAHTRRLARVEAVHERAAEVEQLLKTKSPLPPQLRGQQQQLESLLAGAAALPPGATVEQIEGLERRLDSFYELIAGSKAPPPGTLRSGAIAFLRGDHEEVLVRLAEIPYSDSKARTHSLLLRSAAAFAIHSKGDASDRDLLTRAREDARAVKASAPGLTPVAAAFSPRFVSFFDGVEPAAAPDVLPGG